MNRATGWGLLVVALATISVLGAREASAHTVWSEWNTTPWAVPYDWGFHAQHEAGGADAAGSGCDGMHLATDGDTEGWIEVLPDPSKIAWNSESNYDNDWISGEMYCTDLQFYSGEARTEWLPYEGGMNWRGWYQQACNSGARPGQSRCGTAL